MSPPLAAQLPFYTDDPAVTEPGVLHFEFFDEFDGLQSSEFPDLRQNTVNFKINYGLKHGLELDLDFPYLSIYRAAGAASSTGLGDTDLGIKWNFHKASPGSWVPALGASFYTEFPTGDKSDGLGSGLTDYWLNMIAQKPFNEKIRINANFGFLFAGNTSTGAIGIQTKRGHVFTGGVAILEDFNPRLTLGIEGYGGVADTSGLERTQLQGLIGGEYMIRNGFSFTFGLLGGKYEASPGWELPFAKMWADGPKRLIGGWNLYPIFFVQSGIPLDFLAGTRQRSGQPGPSGAGDGQLVRADQTVNSVHTFNPRKVQTFGGQSGNYWFDPGSFQQGDCITGNNDAPPCAIGYYGTYQRNSFHGPHRSNLDLALEKSTSLVGERTKLVFRAEAFNIFNHAEFRPPADRSVLAGTFGQISSTYDPRILQLALKLVF